LIKTIKYSGISAKIHCLYKKILNREDYKKILKMKTVKELVEYLKSSTHFSNVLSSIDEKRSIHRGEIEVLLKSSILEDYNSIIRFTKGTLGNFLKIVSLKYEIESLKILIRVLETEKNTNIISSSLAFLSDYKDLDIEKLSSSLNTKDFIKNLEGTIYYNILEPYLNKDKEYNLFNLEMELDMFYYSYINKHKKKLFKNDELKTMDKLFGIEIDILNLITIYRCKKYFNIDSGLIFSYLIPSFYRIKKQLIQDLINTENVELFLAKVKETKYNAIFKGENIFFERAADDYLYELNIKNFRKEQFSIALVVSYFKQKELELQSITSVMEGIRYELDEEKLNEYIVGKRCRV
jgi:V/A-type H+-transporting ATPase subunit C